MATEPDEIKLAVMANDITYIKRQIDHIDVTVTANYVTKDEFNFYKRLVWIVLGVTFSGLGAMFFNLITLRAK